MDEYDIESSKYNDDDIAKLIKMVGDGVEHLFE